MPKQKTHNVKLLHGKGLIIDVDGVKYKKTKTKTYKKDGVEHSDYSEFEPFDYDEHQEVLKKIGQKLKDKVPPERVVEELLKGENIKDLKSLLKKLDKGDIRVKTHNGCLGLAFINKKKKKSGYYSIAN